MEKITIEKMFELLQEANKGNIGDDLPEIPEMEYKGYENLDVKFYCWCSNVGGDDEECNVELLLPHTLFEDIFRNYSAELIHPSCNSVNGNTGKFLLRTYITHSDFFGSYGVITTCEPNDLPTRNIKIEW